MAATCPKSIVEVCARVLLLRDGLTPRSCTPASSTTNAWPRTVPGPVRSSSGRIIVAERFSPKSDIRIFGSGGYWGFFGIFSNPRIGRYTAFVGDYKEAVLIQVAIAGGYKSYVVSCRNYDEFIILVNNNRDIRTILSATTATANNYQNGN